MDVTVKSATNNTIINNHNNNNNNAFTFKTNELEKIKYLFLQNQSHPLHFQPKKVIALPKLFMKKQGPN